MSNRRDFDSDWDYADSMKPKKKPFNEEPEEDYFDEGY